MNAPIEKIVILVAMQGEADPIISNLNMKMQDAVALGFPRELGLNVYHVLIQDRDVYLVQNGQMNVRGMVIDRIGTQFAAVVTYAVIQVLKPDTMMSAGTAGGFQGAAIGDVFIADSELVYHDRRIALEGYDVFGEGYYDCMSAPNAARELGLKLGVLSTGSSLDASAQDVGLMEKHGAHVVDMEGAAVGEVAHLFGVRVLMVKAVTNFIDGNLHGDFAENYGVAVGNLAGKVGLLVGFILGKKPSEI